MTHFLRSHDCNEGSHDVVIMAGGISEGRGGEKEETGERAEGERGAGNETEGGGREGESVFKTRSVVVSMSLYNLHFGKSSTSPCLTV